MSKSHSQILFNASFEALGNRLSTTYKVVLKVALITPLGNISIPFPGINVFCLLLRAVLISSTNFSNYSMSPAFVPTIPNNVFNEFICIQQEDNYYWEQIGSVTSDVDMSEYLKTSAFQSYIETVAIQAVDVKTSSNAGNKIVELDYQIPDTIYDYLIE